MGNLFNRTITVDEMEKRVEKFQEEQVKKMEQLEASIQKTPTANNVVKETEKFKKWREEQQQKLAKDLANCRLDT
jgi:hypothetical protein